jgi:oligopeptide transport system permease protein
MKFSLPKLGGAAIIGIFILASLVIDPGFIQIDVDNILAPVSFNNLLGTDDLGRSVFQLLMYASGISLLVAIVGVSISAALAFCFAYTMVSLSKSVETWMMLILNFFTSLPSLIWILVIMSALELKGMVLTSPVGGALQLGLILGLTGWMGMARVFSEELRRVLAEPYIDASRGLGSSAMATLMRHVLPVMAGFGMSSVLVRLPGYVFRESFLSFLGLGIQSPSVSWGLMVKKGLVLMEYSPAMLFAPCVAIYVFVQMLSLMTKRKSDNRISWIGN